MTLPSLGLIPHALGKQTQSSSEVFSFQNQLGAKIVMWEWEVRNGRWQKYEKDVSDILETAHMFDQDEVTVTMHGTQYRISVGQLVQRNLVTNGTRKIRRSVRNTCRFIN